MNAKEFVNSLFEGYEETAALADFKEELLGNLNAKVENLTRKGMDGETAFAKAAAELGDVSALADELSMKKRTEVFEEVYMGIRKYMATSRVVAYVIFGILALLGPTVGAIAFLATRGAGMNPALPMTAMFGSIMPFLVAAAAGLTFLAATQETASLQPLSNKRAAWYTAAAALIALGIFNMPVVFFGTIFGTEITGRVISEMWPYAEPFIGDIDIPAEIVAEFLEGNFGTGLALIPAISLVIFFVLPGIGLLVFLVLTEKDRRKPWAKSAGRRSPRQNLACA